MRWQHGQMVQGAPRIQKHQSAPSCSPETGLSTLPPGSARHARHARIPSTTAQRWGDCPVPERSAARYSRRLQASEGAGLRGPLYRQRLVSWTLGFHRITRYQICFSQAPAYQGGINREMQPKSSQCQQLNPRRFRWEREIAHFTSRRTGTQTRKGKGLHYSGTALKLTNVCKALLLSFSVHIPKAFK